MKKHIQRLALALLICFVLPQPSAGQGGVGNNNPTGIAGEYNGSITTAGSYDPYTGNGKRIVDDIVVTGSLGAYPLKWTRTLNTRYAGWFGGYGYGLWLRRVDSHFHDPPYEGPDGSVIYPDGRKMDFWTDGESYFATNGGENRDRIVRMENENYDLVMMDGGRIRFLNINPGAPLLLRFRATAIIDPYGLTTELTYDTAGRLWRIKEPGGRYLHKLYSPKKRASL
jgi:YD repeat-containing protein